jgi:hypothetical protein
MTRNLRHLRLLYTNPLKEPKTKIRKGYQYKQQPKRERYGRSYITKNHLLLEIMLALLEGEN